MEDESVPALIAVLEQDPANEKAITAVSKNAAIAVFSQEFVARNGLLLLLRALPASHQRASRTNVLRALTLLLEDKWTRKVLLADPSVITTEVLVTLLGLVMSDTVLSVARALHVLSVLTEPPFANKQRLMEAFAAVAGERGRGQKPMSCLRCAFVGFALLDANIHGLTVARHLMDLDSGNLAALEEANVIQAVFPLCENDALTAQVAEFQGAMCRCWRERASVLVQPESHPEHVQLLERLWSNAVAPPRPFPGKTSSEWRLLGFQGDSPASDFRSMGLLALDMLVYFVETCTTEARMIFSVQNSADAEFYYPVATAGILVSSVVLGAVEARAKSGHACPVVLAEGLSKLWVAVLRHLDTIFVESKLTYLQFGDLTKKVTAQLAEVLVQNPLSTAEVATLLKAASESSPVFGSSKKKRNKALSAQWLSQTTATRAKERAPTASEVFSIPAMTTPLKSVRSHGREMKAGGRKLRKACVKGDAKKVIEILGQGKGEGYSLVNDPDPDTRATPLHLACHGGHVDCVRLVSGAGAAMESVAVGLGTPLHCAAQAGSVEAARVLLDAGAKGEEKRGDLRACSQLLFASEFRVRGQDSADDGCGRGLGRHVCLFGGPRSRRESDRLGGQRGGPDVVRQRAGGAAARQSQKAGVAHAAHVESRRHQSPRRVAHRLLGPVVAQALGELAAAGSRGVAARKCGAEANAGRFGAAGGGARGQAAAQVSVVIRGRQEVEKQCESWRHTT